MNKVKNYYTDNYGNLFRDEDLREVVNDLIVLITTMQEKINNLQIKILNDTESKY